MKRCLFFLILGGLLWPALGLAEDGREADHKLDEIVVTSTRKSKAVDTPASLSIITAEELEDMGAKNIVEALSKIPGVVDSSSKSQSVVIRGNKSAMAGGPVLLMDGVPLKLGDYRYSEFDFIPVNQIERIEVLRSAGIAYGPGAARGVINVITKKSKSEGVHGDVSASYGSWDSHDENVSLYGMKNKFDFLVDAENYHTDGYEEEEENRQSVLGRLGYNLSDQSRIGLRVNHVDYDNQTAEGLKKYQWQLDNYRREIHFPKSETDSDLLWHNEKDEKNTTVALEFSHKAEKKFFDSSFSWATYEKDFRRTYAIYDSPTSVYYEDSDQDTYSLTMSGGYHFDFGSVSYTPTIGIDYEDIDNTVGRIYPYYPTKNTDTYNFDLQEKTYGVFWDNNLRFNEKWGLDAGIRFDRTEVEFQDKVPNIVDEDRDMFSYSIAPSYHFNDQAMIYASVGRNYWFPTPRYYAWAVEKGGSLNPVEDLEPEEVLTYELGYKHLFSKAFNINATIYYSEYKDKFGSVYDENDDSCGQGNIGDAEAKGIEIEADGRLCQYFGYRVAATYQDIEWTSGTAFVYIHPDNTRDYTADISGKQIYWVPEISGVIGLDFYPMAGLKISMDINYIGERYVDYLNQIEYPDKTTFDARASYTWKAWKVWVLGKNIFDEDLEYASNSSGKLNSDGEPNNAYYVQNGAYVEAGISYHF
ncbi:TonB-dependent receptor [Desulfosarcina ovata]|uniref:Ligand-gated channel n=1 Tax=Desulfosarcina ovata subsp. ovata TaxID=2752305 RepID=A0A5K8A5W6_9BACT|nr:TonB-dependent receptor [Desulfosarcina ovata]BBO87897.1 ligand-gated channel [Desulfosarcina ovata subsp. ovata]